MADRKEELVCFWGGEGPGEREGEGEAKKARRWMDGRVLKKLRDSAKMKRGGGYP